MTSGHAVFFHARGEIKGYSLFIMGNVISQLILAIFLTAFLNLPPYSIVLIVLAGTLVNTCYRILYAVPAVPAKEAIQLWFSTCFFPVFVPCIVAIGSGVLVTLVSIINGWTRLAIVILVHSAVLSVFVWTLGLQRFEKEKFQFYICTTLGLKQS